MSVLLRKAYREGERFQRTMMRRHRREHIVCTQDRGDGRIVTHRASKYLIRRARAQTNGWLACHRPWLYIQWRFRRGPHR